MNDTIGAYFHANTMKEIGYYEEIISFYHSNDHEHCFVRL